VLIKRVTTQNLLCEKDYLIALKPEVAAEQQANGQLEKLKCLLNSTKLKAEATRLNYVFKEISKEFKEMD